MVKKSTPANALISPVCWEPTRRQGYGSADGTWVAVSLDQKAKTRCSTYVTEAGTHDDGFVAVLFVVVEDLLHRYDTRVLVTFIILPGRLLVPIKDLCLEGLNWRRKNRVSHGLERSE